MHKTTGVRDPAAAFPLPSTRDDAQERREANRAIAVSAIGLAATGVAELVLAVLTGSVGLLGDAIHNLSDVSTSAVVFLGFRLSRKGPTERYPYGLDRAEDLAGIGIGAALVDGTIARCRTTSPRWKATAGNLEAQQMRRVLPRRAARRIRHPATSTSSY
jgi:Co/Zn/Cd efflux system component